LKTVTSVAAFPEESVMAAVCKFGFRPKIVALDFLTLILEDYLDLSLLLDLDPYRLDLLVKIFR
jgi:hypothetical protein